VNSWVSHSTPTSGQAGYQWRSSKRLEIVKALASDARILLLDEPTAVLAPAEAEELLRVIRTFTLSGRSAVLITHKLDEALRTADRVTVLRQGEGHLLGDNRWTNGGVPGSGHDWPSPRPCFPLRISIRPPTRPPSGRELIRFEALEVSRESGYGIAVRHGSLVVREGEIVGVAAVEGNGQRELLRVVAGRINAASGGDSR